MPGVWLVLSGWSPELVPDPAGHALPAGECQALALALTAVSDGRQCGRLSGCDRAELTTITSRDQPGRTGGDLGGPGRCLHQTIATDPSGRLRIELVNGWDDPK